MDKNGNGQIDRDEIESLPGFIKDMYTRQGIDGSRPVSKNEFLDLSNKIRDDMRARMDRGDFRRGGGLGFGGGPPPNSNDKGKADTPRPEESEDRDFRRDDRHRDDDSQDRRSSTSSSKSKKVVKPKVRVTKELPDEYRERDKNGDGQIGLYEWDRKAFTKFQELDRNADGFLTPNELITPVTKKSSDNSKAAIAASSGRSSDKTNSSKSKDEKTSDKESRADAKKMSPDKPASAEKSAPAADTPGDTAFRSLDVNKDGQLDVDEWERARSASKRFKNAGITVSLPIKQSQFVEFYNAANGNP